MKSIAILGSTGSIGTQTLEIVRARRNDFRVTALAANRNVELLEQQIREFSPVVVCVYEEEYAKDLRARVRDLPVRIVTGMQGLIEVATEESAEITVGAIVGMIGILPTVEAVKAGKDIAIANKETLVTAGHIILPLVKEKGVRLLPVDSEHSAIFQCLEGERQNKMTRILLTASGGPFRGKTMEELRNIRPEDALKHPNWVMGRKVTIDSSTLVNKGLEVMEAHWLFDASYDQIEVVVQPQSVIHSMVEFEDGAVKAQLGTPDMKIPIQYALDYPKRAFLAGKRLEFDKICSITFEKPDLAVFRGLRIAYEVGRKGGNAPTVFNAANECAVAAFLDRKLPYLEIPAWIEKALDKVPFIENPSLEEVFATEQAVREVLL